MLFAASYHDPKKLPKRPEELWGEKVVEREQTPEEMFAILKQIATHDETK